MGNVGQSSVNLAYDASGNMIEQTSGSATTQIVYAPDGTKLALMNGTSTLVKAFVPLTGGATAVYNSTGLAAYRHSDWLGSARLTSSSASPTQATSETAYGPFGEVYWSSGTPDPSFTGMNQDADPSSGIYDFPAREYEMQGRWPSPDPLGVGAVDPTDPQSWNRYAYVRNSPLTLTDPNGMDYIFDCGAGYDIQAPSFFCGATVGGETVDDLRSDLLVWGMQAMGDNDSGSVIDSAGNFIATYEYYQDTSSIDVTTNQCITACPPTPPSPVPDPEPVIPIDPGLPITPGGPGTPAGGGGVASASQTQQQKQNQCMSDFNNSTVGKVTSFFSILELPSHLWEWFGLGGAKAAGVGALDHAEAASAVEGYSLTTGATTKASTLTGSKVLGTAGLITMAAATTVDAAARQGCADPNPAVRPALGPIIIPQPIF